LKVRKKLPNFLRELTAVLGFGRLRQRNDSSGTVHTANEQQFQQEQKQRLLQQQQQR
jgi:hypothetical protein